MEDEILLGIVEVMAKHQHERGLSSHKLLRKSHTIHKDERILKMKKTDLSHVNKHEEEGANIK